MRNLRKESHRNGALCGGHTALRSRQWTLVLQHVSLPIVLFSFILKQSFLECSIALSVLRVDVAVDIDDLIVNQLHDPFMAGA